ncbi:LutC/YkgG family protein [Insolitispirillum peregrinum]|uniref:LutC/YkgG family protein n=1 Tax=Insolitispirillum peregrinum TaxID=80876 RepID=UPI00361AD522
MNNSATARANILARLKAAPRTAVPERPEWQPPVYDADQRVNRFASVIEASHAEVHHTTADAWPALLAEVMQRHGLDSLMYAPGTVDGQQVATAWGTLEQAPALVPYDRPVEELKDTLVNGVAAGLTATRAAIAETGSLVLWPTAEEPRLMSLLPPVHVAVVRAETVVDTLAVLMASQHWAQQMPTNVVLVSGPSKTADIEQTLAYGVHGPKELIVLIVH